MTPDELTRLAAWALPGQKPSEVRLLKKRYAGLVLEVTTVAGRRLVLKTGAQTYNPELEATMLAALRSGGLPVPAVVDAHRGALVLEHCPGRPPTTSADWAGVAHALRELHAATCSTRYGFDHDTVFGVLPLTNCWSNDWPSFFCNQRLRPLVDRGWSSGRLPAAEAAQLLSLCETIATRMPPPPAAALIHGDIWSDNVLVTATGPVFVDPACFYADPDYEMAFAQTYAPRKPSSALRRGAASRRDRNETRLRTRYYRLFFHLAHLVLFGRPCFLSAVRSWLAVLEAPATPSSDHTRAVG